MRENPVLWHEGMLVSPHHFQASERYQAESHRLHQQLDHPYGYGLLSLDVNAEAYAAGHFEVIACQARLRDGTLISIGQQQGGPGAGLRRNVIKELQDQPLSMVYLAVPKDREGWSNVSQDHQGGNHRYAAINVSIADETNPEVARPVTFRKLNIKLLVDTDDLSGYEVLPIAKVRRGTDGSSIELDYGYIPPLVSTDAWRSMRTQMVQPILDLAESKITQMTQPLKTSGVNLASLQSADTSRIILGMMLNGEFANLRHYVSAKDNHPATVYRDLCRFAGLLAVFHPDRQLLNPMPYDHDNLGTIYRWVKRWIEDSLKGIPLISYEMRYFVTNGKVLGVDIENSWLQPGWQWFIGVHRGVMGRDKCVELLKSIYKKVGSARQVETLFDEKRPDTGFVLADNLPSVLPSGQGWDFYGIDQSTPAWRDVAETCSIGMRISDREVVRMVNGEKEVFLNNAPDNSPLQFAVFAVAPK